MNGNHVLVVLGIIAVLIILACIFPQAAGVIFEIIVAILEACI